MAPLSPEALEYAVNHVFLPPKLPQELEAGTTNLDADLIQATLRALEEFQPAMPVHSRAIIDRVIGAINLMTVVHGSADGSVSETEFASALKALSNGAGSPIALHVRAQNAGVLITRVDASVHFECFELSPVNSAVMCTRGRLVRTFPGSAVSVDVAKVVESDFQTFLAHTLSKMSHQVVPGMQPQTHKGGRTHDEERDTTSPAIVAELLFGALLKANGRPAGRPAITKNTRDDVLWNNTKVPWRRSPAWLLVRVVLQLLFARSGPQGLTLYKSFMIWFVNGLLEQACHGALDSDTLYAMNAKVARRMDKLGSDMPASVKQRATISLKKSHRLLADRWSKIQQLERAPTAEISDLKSLSFSNDSHLELPLLEQFVASMSLRKPPKNMPTFVPSEALSQFQPDAVQLLGSETSDQYEAAELQGFEEWVAVHAGGIFAACDVSGACQDIKRIINNYHQRSMKLYQNNPEGISIMILTIMELWIMSDRLARAACEVFAEYKHGIPADVFQNLVLPFKEQMQRLHKIESYLNQRNCSTGQRPALLSNCAVQKEFAVRYFDSSLDHQELRDSIIEISEAQKQGKFQELQAALTSFKELEVLRDQHKCQQKEVSVRSKLYPFDKVTKTVHDDDQCQFCPLHELLTSARIRLHEEPLPSDDSQAKVIVFELQVPEWYAAWRDITVYLLHDVLKATYDQKETADDRPLSRDPHVGGFSSSCHDQRIVLLSKRKSHVATHYRWKMIESIRSKDVAVLEEVLRTNDTNYQYYDLSAKCFIDRYLPTEDAARDCTYQLGQRSSFIERFIFRPASSPNGVSPNVVIASQSECPEFMALGEYEDLLSMPFGHHIQWINIAEQLTAPSIDLRKDETVLLILQCISQASPIASDEGDQILRASHALLSHGDFSRSLLGSLESALQRVKDNWESANALVIFAAIANRLLDLASPAAVHAACLEFLAKVRSTAFTWIVSLRWRSHQSSILSEQTQFAKKSVEVALVCMQSFDVNQKHLTKILATRTEAAVLMKCSLVVSEGSRPDTSPVIDILSLRSKRLLGRSLSMLKSSHGALDAALQWAWPGHRPDHEGWHSVAPAFHNWLTTEITISGQLQQLHYDVISGEFLINGTHSMRPPSSWKAHATYIAMFGTASLELAAARVPSMRYCIKREFEGHAVCLDMTSTEPRELLIRAESKFGTFELIPSRVFRGFVPEAFVTDFAYWYNTDTGVVELRPSGSRWKFSSAAVWTICRHPEGWHFAREGKLLLGLETETLQCISRVLSPLVDPSLIHAVLDSWHRQLEVEIPSLQLGFTLSSGDWRLLSREFPGFFIDSDQSLGMLVGLFSKLVLKSQKDASRMVLLPEGKIQYQSHDGHVSVVVDKATISKVHPVSVDTRLSRLVDNGSLQSKLLLAYFSALTSFCLPDPFTLRTGTEQALSILGSAAVHSFEKLEAVNIDILSEIASLTPSRCYYPPEDKVMQTVGWKAGLSYLSQHGNFILAVHSILERAKETIVFHPDSRAGFSVFAQVDKDLLDRDLLRTSSFRVSGFGADEHTQSYDAPYDPRDLDAGSERASRSYVISQMVNGKIRFPCWKMPSPLLFWKAMSNLSVVHGYEGELDADGIRYDASFLEGGAGPLLRRLLPLYRAMSEEGTFNKYSMAMWLSSLAFSPADIKDLLQVAILFPTVAVLGELDMPSSLVFHPDAGLDITSDQLAIAIEKDAAHAFEQTPDFIAPRRAGKRGHPESLANWKSRIQDDYQRHKHGAARLLANMMKKQWTEQPNEPIKEPVVKSNTSDFIDVARAVEVAQDAFAARLSNRDLQAYFFKAIPVLSSLPIVPVEVPAPIMPMAALPPRRLGFMSVDNLFSSKLPRMPVPRVPELVVVPNTASQERNGRKAMHTENLIRHLSLNRKSANNETAYIADLKESYHSLKRQSNLEPPVTTLPNRSKMNIYLKECEQHLDAVHAIVMRATGYSAFDAGRQVQQWPRVSPLLLLQQLSRKRWPNLSKSWKALLVQYALAIFAVQRAERLLKAERLSIEDLKTELQNPGHTNWSPYDYPETLLMEVESGITVRIGQEEIASRMRVRSGPNAVMQLNMGEGKSSVIVPMVAAALADGSQLVRVIVAKPQSKQMAQMLISKLGGLLDRRIHYLPFSRSLKPSQATMEAIERLVKTCMADGGVLLMQPEHILSFKLTGPECFIVGNDTAGRALLRMQDFFDNHSRDVVDESDENFSVRFELIYTMGLRRAVEMAPARWVYVQKVLVLVKTQAAVLALEQPQSVEYIDRFLGGFPRMRILRDDAGRVLVHRIALQICENGLLALSMAQQTESVRNACFTYITEPNPTREDTAAIHGSSLWSDHTKGPLLLLRGLLAGGILEFIFGAKRWRVNYGLTTRAPATKLAVPFRAKDNPSPRSEFSHPDVVIGLTSLCYYYGGLSDDDLFVVLGHLIDSDRAETEWSTWLEDIDMPVRYRQLDGINLKDRTLCRVSIFPLIRYSKAAIDFFLSRFVFPKEMKEYDKKLSSSGWDIGRKKRLPTTGFSGTNDSKSLLPLDVYHKDLKSQKHTNARVLECLLSPKNSVALIPSTSLACSNDAQRLLSMVMALIPSPEVILDVGAQILELDNLDFAKEWLNLHPTKEAVVFCSNDDELSVVNRKSEVELLQTSSFASRLDVCLVYLDEAHTRGIDLKLPLTYRAAVTLGANLSKDKAVQACMRMRRLAEEQSVVFCVPEEIRTKILECRDFLPANGPSLDHVFVGHEWTDRETPQEAITVADVLTWTISETYAEISRCMPLWAVQGHRFIVQEMLWRQVRAAGSLYPSQQVAKKFLEPEALSLERRYAPRMDKKPALVLLAEHPDQSFNEISRRCQAFNNLEFKSKRLQEEQERELSPEVVAEPIIQRVAAAIPAKHSLHRDLVSFVENGVIKRESAAYFPAFDSFSSTTAALKFDVQQLRAPAFIYATADFASTVARDESGSFSDSYQRAVRWEDLKVLTTRKVGHDVVGNLIVISPFEAEHLFERVQQSQATALHLYRPRANLGHPALDKLDFCTIASRPVKLTIPAQLSVQLNVFAGQLYFGSFQEYRQTCIFLGLAWQKAAPGCIVAADGFVESDAQGQVGGGATSKVRASPIKFIRALMTTIRRNGEDIGKTHMGAVLEGRLLQPSDFEK